MKIKKTKRRAVAYAYPFVKMTVVSLIVNIFNINSGDKITLWSIKKKSNKMKHF